jgi:hypothetical protein
MSKPIYKKWWFIAIISVVVLVIIGSLLPDSENTSSNGATSEESLPNIGVGEVLKTDYFEITVNNVSINDMVDVGNEFANLKSEPGNKFFILDVTFKNIDDESRYLYDGIVYVTYNNKPYKFDKVESVLYEGWEGTTMKEINPLTTYTTKLVYKIPSEIVGAATYQPGRAGSDEKIFLGNIE